ncbi:hypothetical protein FKM82_006778 [Ascaphus truei]
MICSKIVCKEKSIRGRKSGRSRGLSHRRESTREGENMVRERENHEKILKKGTKMSRNANFCAQSADVTTRKDDMHKAAVQDILLNM